MNNYKPEIAPISKFFSIIRIVQFILIALFLILIGLDIYLALDDIEDNTISSVIKNNTDNGLFVLTYFWGAVAANIFLYSPKKIDFNGTVGSIIIILIAILIIIFDVEQFVDKYFTRHHYNISIYSLSMIFGVLMGWLFWRQDAK